MNINDAIAYEQSRSFFTYKSERPLDNPPVELERWTKEDWDSLSPGMKRAIERDIAKYGDY